MHGALFYLSFLAVEMRRHSINTERKNDVGVLPHRVRLGTGSSKKDKDSWPRQQSGNRIQTGSWSWLCGDHWLPAPGEGGAAEASPEGLAGDALPETRIYAIWLNY